MDATKNYTFVFLLAGSEVVLSALVLATCNFFFIKKTSSAPEETIQDVSLTSAPEAQALRKDGELSDQEEKGAREEQEKETEKDEGEEEEVPEVRPESVEVDSQEVERFLKEPQQNGDVAVNPETCL